VSCSEKPHPSELAERCDSCGEGLDERGECCALGCVEYELATHGPIRYYAELPWGRVPCATFRRAIEACAGQPWSRIVRADYVPVDEDDDGLTELEHHVLEMGDCDGRDALVALIDGNAAKAA
jgi:hypothetical protein